ncbi:hypothetical protein MIC448_1600006 [Microbacterium sp. C448]|nr:hypothetical protein MIC448_1600006 [Microbacterium sp. C448]
MRSPDDVVAMAVLQLHRLGGADQTTDQARPSDQESLVVEDFEGKRIAACRADSRIQPRQCHHARLRKPRYLWSHLRESNPSLRPFGARSRSETTDSCGS